MIVHLKILANAKKNSFCGFEGEFLKVKIARPAIDGKANEELIAFLSSFLSLSKSDIRILKGERSHYKTIELPIHESEFKLIFKKVSKDANL